VKSVCNSTQLVSTFIRCAAAVAGLALLLTPLAARCDDVPTAMAPPTSAPAVAPSTDTSSVFNWKEVPENQKVPITRGVFDQGGYQLYDNVGETIVVPFANNNLYVMKFAKSDDGTMYFINDGTYPILYVPKGGYLENATVPGAKWYPFTPKFHPSTAVFLGIAPSWHAFIGMGWYPDMMCYGGYYCNAPFGDGIFIGTPGFFLAIGGFSCYSWHD